MNTNLESSKKHNIALEDRNKQLHDITAKHEASVTALRKELMDCQNNLSKCELQIDSLQMKNRHLLSTQGRLEAERDVLLKEKNSTSRIEANLQQIQINLQRNEELGKLKLQSDNEKLLKEVELLRTKVETEQEHFKDSVKTWENANKNLREKSEAAIVSEKNALEQLNSISNTLETMKMELKDTTERLELAESRLAGRGLGRQASSIEGQPGEAGKNRLRDVELLMAQTKQELKNVNMQLIEAKRKGEEYKGISEAAEKRMVESSAAMQELQSQLETKVKKAEESKQDSEKKVELIEIENRELKSKLSDLESEAGTSGGELRDRVRNCLTEMEDMKAKLATSKVAEEEARENATKWLNESKETQEKYEREIVQHARDIEALSRLKQELKNTNNKADMDLERKKHEDQVKLLEEKHMTELNVLKQGKTAVDQQLEVLSAQNENLLSQLESVSKQLTDMTNAGLNTSGHGQDSSMVSNVSINEEDANNTQLMAIIKYLRQEKEILSGRVELMQAESARLQSQLEHASSQLTESEAALEKERSSQSSSIMSASKHSDLIRKVETLSAVTDSNRMLREEKEKFEKENESLKATIKESEALKIPLEEKLKQSEEKVSALVVEKLSLQSEVEKWKKRSDQLVEKSFKINPKELARLTEAEAQLTKSVKSLEAEKKQVEEKFSNQSKEFEAVRQQCTSLHQEKNKMATDIQEKLKELATTKKENSTAKNIQANLQREINGLKKKTEEIVKTHNMEMAKMKKDAEENKAGGEEVNNLRKELEDSKVSSLTMAGQLDEAKKTIESLQTDSDKLKSNNNQLKQIGKTMRSKFQAEEKKVKELEEEKAKLIEEKLKLEEELCTRGDVPTADEAASEGSDRPSKEELDEATNLLAASQARLDELEAQAEEKNKEIEELRKKSNEQQTRAKSVLSNAKQRIEKVTEEKKLLQQELDTLTAGGSGLSDEQELRRKAMASQLNSLRQDKEKLEAEKNEAAVEKEKMMEQIEALQQELVAAQLASQQKPVAVAGVVHQQDKVGAGTGARKQQQPQAHIQPQTRPQTASIRPTVQARPGPAVVLPSQVSSVVATVQPTLTVSPSPGTSGTSTSAGISHYFHKYPVNTLSVYSLFHASASFH